MGRMGMAGRRWSWRIPNTRRWWMMRRCGSGFPGGMPGTEMPAFAQSAGGMLTDAQMDAIIAGMRKEWAKPNAFGGATPPSYAHGSDGRCEARAGGYQARCASCHQNPARQQVTSPVYLSLVSDQALRTVIIAGRADIGQPDWRLAECEGCSAFRAGCNRHCYVFGIVAESGSGFGSAQPNPAGR